MAKRDSIVIVSIVFILALVILLWFLYFNPTQEESEKEQEERQPTRAEELRRENAGPRFEPLSDERKAELREEAVRPRPGGELSDEEKTRLREENK